MKSHATWGRKPAFFVRTLLLALAVLCPAVLCPAAGRAATIGTLSAVTVSAAVLTGGQAAGDAAILGPQSFTITAANTYPTSARISISLDITGASFAAAPTIAGLTCQSVTRVLNHVVFETCAVATLGDVAFAVSNVTYTGASGLSVYGSTVRLSGSIYNSSNTNQVFETIPSVVAITSPALAYTLTTTKAGAGTGTVAVSTPAPYSYGTTVTLTANAAGGSAFSAWGGACTGSAVTCTLDMTANKAVTATFIVANTYALTTQTAGTGAGVVTASPAASAYLSGTVVTLTATPQSGSAFTGWSGACTGTVATCSVTMSAAKSVTATFTSVITYTLVVSTTGSGAGTVTANPAVGAYIPGAVVTLTAAAASGSTFAGWSDGCSGTATTCTVTMSANKTVSAVFNALNSYTLTTGKAGNGSGTIFASPTGPSYVAGTAVTLTAIAEAGSVFTGWSGDCSGTSATCQLTMSANKTATGTFTRTTTGVLRQGGVSSTAAATYQSFLRFYNAGGSAGTVTVTLSDSATGLALGQWTSPSIAPGTAPQYAISTIEGAVAGAKPALYSVTMQAQFNGTFQHVLWKPADGTLTNLSTCDSGTAPIAARAANVHGGILGNAGYPGSIVVYNTSTVAAPVVLHVADAATGASLGTYTSAIIPANGQVVVPVSALETAAAITPTAAMSHYIVTVQNMFTGYIQHLLNNTRVGVITDMSIVCTFPAITVTVPTNPSGAP